MKAQDLLAVVLLALCGCDKKADVKAGVAELERAFPTAAAPGEPGRPAPAPPAAHSADAYVRTALAAARSNDYVAGVVALQNVARARGVTAEQLRAAERAQKAMIHDLLTRAAQGDARAKAALAAIERTRSQ